MGKPLRLLLVGDCGSDTDRLLGEIERAGYAPSCTRVETIAALWDRIGAAAWDIGILEYALLGPSPADTLAGIMERCGDRPVILVSGAVQLETAIPAMRAGARDFLAKGDMAQLVLAIDREARAAGEHNARVASGQRETRAVRERLAAIVDSCTDSVIGLSPSGIVESWNRGATRLYGYAAAAMIGRPIMELMPPDREDGLPAMLRDLVEGRQVMPFDTVRRHQDGRAIDVSTSVSAVHDGSGNLIGSVDISHDVSERRRAESTLRKLSRAVEQSPISVVIADLDGTIEYVNPRFCQLTGYSATEVIGRNQSILQAEYGPKEQSQSLWQTISAGGTWTGELRNKKKNGELYWEEASISPIHDPDGITTHYVSVKEDITHRKQVDEACRLAEDALRVSERRLRAVIAHAPIVLFALDRDGVFTFCDGGAPANHGASHPEALIGKSVHAVIAEFPHLADQSRRALAGEAFSTIAEVRDRVFEVWWSPEHDAAGEASGGTGLAVDVTDTIRARRGAERAQEAAVELARLRSDFVAAISHELRTPLTAVIGYGEMLQTYWGQLDDTQRLDRVSRIVLAAHRQKRLVEDLLLLTQMDVKLVPPHVTAVNLAVLVRHVAEETAGVYPGQRIQMEGPGTLHALADPDRTMQILANLVDNAAKYSVEGSPIAVSWVLEDNAVVVRVRDAGTGIPDERRAHLFTRFGRIPGSRIRSGHVGTGLGLYLGREFARAMGGELELESSGPSGSTFRLRLPAAAG